MSLGIHFDKLASVMCVLELTTMSRKMRWPVKFPGAPPRPCGQKWGKSGSFSSVSQHYWGPTMWIQHCAEHHGAYKDDLKRSKMVYMTTKDRRVHLYRMTFKKWLIIIICLDVGNLMFLMKSGEPLSGSQSGQFYSAILTPWHLTMSGDIFGCLVGRA